MMTLCVAPQNIVLCIAPEMTHMVCIAQGMEVTHRLGSEHGNSRGLPGKIVAMPVRLPLEARKGTNLKPGVLYKPGYV
jgi:hypothetical protein